MNSKNKLAWDYIRRMHNDAKRKYAMDYLKWQQRGRVSEPPTHDGLGAMGAQAVRMMLDDIEEGRDA